MSPRPLLFHALLVPRRRLLGTLHLTHVTDVPNIKSNDHRKWSSAALSSIRRSSQQSHSLLTKSTGISQTSYYVSNSPSIHQKNYKSPALSTNLNCTSRTFASRRRGGQKGKKGKHNSKILSNENLITRLIENAAVSSADEVKVRLVVDEGPDKPSFIEIITLSEAIVLSLDRELDLIGANINGDPPVIRATQLSKLEYKQQQAQKKQQQSASNKKEEKSFRFKAGIEANDLERKLDRLKGFLAKGHDCEFTVFTRARMLRQKPNAGVELVEQIKALLSDYGDMKRPPQTNETKSFYRVQYQPKK